MRLQKLDWYLVVGLEGQMQSTAAAANYRMGLSDPRGCDSYLSIFDLALTLATLVDLSQSGTGAGATAVPVCLP